MGVIFHEEVVKKPDLHNYEPEYNEDGSEKHIHCDGARYHVLSWGIKDGIPYQRCSEPNCEINHQQKKREEEYKKNNIRHQRLDVRY